MSSTNPIGSTTMPDLFLNAGNLDRAMNGDQDKWTDRFGIERITYSYMERVTKNGQGLILSREALKRSYAEAGLNLVDGSFEEGAYLNFSTDVLLQESTGLVFQWTGEYPKMVVKNTVPSNEWVQTSKSLRGTFVSSDGKGLNNFFAGGAWTGSDAESGAVFNSTGAIYTNASRWRFSLKETEKTKDPTIWLNKRTVLDRADGVNRWDAGNIYAALDKVGGDAYCASISGIGRHLAGEGDVIGLHGRSYGYHGKSKVWGGWFYAASRPDPVGGDNESIIDLIGIEINMNNNRKSVSYTPEAGKGLYRGLIVATADGSKNCHIGIDVVAQLSTNAAPWYVGMRVRQDSIMPFDSSEGDLAAGILIEGSSSLAKRYPGIVLRNGCFHVGIDLSQVDTIDNNSALVLKNNDRIRWGTRTSSRYISASTDTAMVNFNNYAIAINNIKVLGERQLGLFALTGTSSGASINTETCTLQELARYVKKFSDNAINSGWTGPTN